MMDKAVLDHVVASTRKLIEAPTCNSETKASAQAWLDALGTAQEAAQTKTYITELEGDIMPIDQLIGFSDSEQGAQYFGAELAANIAAHAKEIKAAGAKHCDCPACAAVAEILEKKAQML